MWFCCLGNNEYINFEAVFKILYSIRNTMAGLSRRQWPSLVPIVLQTNGPRLSPIVWQAMFRHLPHCLAKRKPAHVTNFLGRQWPVLATHRLAKQCRTIENRCLRRQ
jgi:hypothetical protein